VNASCNGAANGSATAVANSGTEPFSFEWSNGRTTATNSSLAAGTYFVTITDAEGCFATETVTITQPAAINATVNIIEEVTCNGGNNAQAAVNVNGGISPFAYDWSNGATTRVATNLAAGTYRVSVEDGNGCVKVETVVISEPAPVNPNASATNVSAPGANDGTASALPSGGTSPYTFRWNTGAMQPNISGLAPGSYTVTVTDNNGCSRSQTVSVGEPDCAVLLSTNSVPAGCNGSDT